MKKSIFIILIVFAVVTKTSAQDYNFLVGGTIGYGYSSIKSTITPVSYGNTDVKTLSGSPFFGYFVSRKAMIGLAIEFNVVNKGDDLETTGPGRQHSDLLLSPSMRYYLNSSIFVLGQGNIGKSQQQYVTISNVETDEPIYIEKNSSSLVVGYGIGLGYDVNLLDNLKLEPMIRYVSNTYKNEDEALDYKVTTVLLRMGLIYLF